MKFLVATIFILSVVQMPAAASSDVVDDGAQAERGGRASRPERAERASRPERAERASRPERAERASKPERSAGPREQTSLERASDKLQRASERLTEVRDGPRTPREEGKAAQDVRDAQAEWYRANGPDAK